MMDSEINDHVAIEIIHFKFIIAFKTLIMDFEQLMNLIIIIIMIEVINFNCCKPLNFMIINLNHFPKNYYYKAHHNLF